MVTNTEDNHGSDDEVLEMPRLDMSSGVAGAPINGSTYILDGRFCGSGTHNFH